MKFKIVDKRKGWKIRFAFIPFELDGEVIWLERYWSRFEGYYYNVRTLEDVPFKDNN